MPIKPLCFVLMPFKVKDDPAGGGAINFDRIYETGIKPAIEDAGMEPIRADEERIGGIIHKPMFERLLLCDYAVADLTTANANVFYELGVRHTARRATTLTIYAEQQPIPFDVNFLRSMPYSLGKGNKFGKKQAKALRAAVAAKLNDLRDLAVEELPMDSPLFRLVPDWKPDPIAHLQTDAFQKQARVNEGLKNRLAAIREVGKDKEARPAALNDLQELQDGLGGTLDAVEAATAIDIMLSYRALEDWDGMIAAFDDMPAELQQQIMVREQLGFAYNRRAGVTKSPADRAEALRILAAVEKQQGANSETCGLIGRIHKDNWTDAVAAGKTVAAAGHLQNAIDAYRRGFMADQRDAYPGINALTLLDIKGGKEALAEKSRLLPVVRFAVERRLEGSVPNYWDHATMLELAVLNDDPNTAAVHLASAIAAIRESFEPDTTANNLRIIERARTSRGDDTPWLSEIIDELDSSGA